jgi:hypothetical protein
MPACCPLSPSLSLTVFHLGPSAALWMEPFGSSYASYVGHHNMVSYFGVVENESIGRVKYEFLQRMLLPCGLPPKAQDQSEEEEEKEE